MLILTMGAALRGLLRWMASAINSLPVPLSPRISTGARVAATCAIVSSTFNSFGCSPTIPLKSYLASSAARVRLLAAGGVPRSSVAAIRSTSWALSQGFVKKLAAPAFTPRTASAIEPQAVIRSTGRDGCAALMRASRSRPSSPLVCSEKFMSCNTTSNGPPSSAASASRGPSAHAASKPACLRRRASETWTAWSSSTTSTRRLRCDSMDAYSLYS
jgi:hypothetical protein